MKKTVILVAALITAAAAYLYVTGHTHTATAAIVEQTVATLGRLDILVNNAGILRRSPAVDFSEADWDAVINVNLKAVFFLCQAAARQFIAQGSGGKIVKK